MTTIEATGLKMDVKRRVFEADGHFTEIVDYSVSIAESMSGTPLPATGIRFGLGFEGSITGSFEGTLSGVCYLDVRADCSAPWSVTLWGRVVDTVAVTAQGCGGGGGSARLLCP